LEKYKGKLYAGGDFDSTDSVGKNFGEWDGTQWNDVGDVRYVANIDFVEDLVAGKVGGNYRLFVGGDFGLVGDYDGGDYMEVENLAQWDGSNWDSVRDVPVYTSALTIDTVNQQLYVSYGAAQFHGIQSRTIVMWDGQKWHGLGRGIKGGEPNTLQMYHGELYTGGSSDSAGTISINNIARWNGRQWKDVNGGAYCGAPCGGVADLAVFQDTLYVGGVFRMVGLNADTSFGLAKWHTPKCAYLEAGIRLDTIDWGEEGAIFVDNSAGLWIDSKTWYFSDGTVKTGDTATYPLGADQGIDVELVVDYQYPDGTFCTDTARDTILGGSVGEEKRIVEALNVIPNPARAQLTIQLHLTKLSANTQVVITNNQGQQVKAFQVNKREQKLRYNTSGLSSGVYFVTVQQQGRAISTEKVVLE
jgi:hypothetical protein